MRTTSLLLGVLLAVGMLFGMAGCAEEGSSLDDTSWVLASLGPSDALVPVVEGADITLAFNSAEGMVRGYGGDSCYFGPYEIDGDSISIEALQCTQSGDDIAELVAQESLYFAAIVEAETYSLSGDELRLNCGDVVLVYRRASQLGG